MKWSEFIIKVGIPGAIALWLVYTMTTNVTGEMTAISKAMNAHTINTDNLMRNSDEMSKALLRICINTAKNKQQADQCLQ